MRKMSRDLLSVTLGAGGITQFCGPRDFAAVPRQTPKQNASGGKTRLGKISKMGSKLLVVGAHAVLCHRDKQDDALRGWARAADRGKRTFIRAGGP